ncbi:MAG: DUF3488 domain-containing protein [Proteobacteria bacterium]|nr:DUF3488 domain-containing protein [Pseudomonadota bacterium]
MKAPAAAQAVPLPFLPLALSCAAFGGGLLLHIDRVPAWASLAALVLIAWRLGAARRASFLPGPYLRSFLALAMSAVVLARFHTLNGLSAGTTLLTLMAALKLLETHKPRDEAVLIGAGLFLLLAACLDRQDLVRAPLYALQAWLCCTALAALATPELPLTRALRLSARTLLLAAPLAVALFVFFPRLPGSFWAIPRGNSALTGLSDSISPGSITQLVADYSVAFRARFSGSPPPRPQLYWRGPVLHQFDGRTWRRLDTAARPPLHLEFLGEPVHYRIALEPTQQRFWFALDTPAAAPAGRVFLTSDSQLVSAEPVTQATAYEAVSYLATRTRERLAAVGIREDTALPPGSNPRTRELATRLREHSADDAALAAAALDFLRTNGFVYSLEPQPLGPNAVDDFLFRTREGFCGHYASAFVTLMRAAGVPAHVVTGYLGGEWNPIGGYFEVHQSDAHAWTEVWIAGRGWVRIDPTAVVAPERLTRGMLQLMPQAYPLSEQLLQRSAWLTALLQRWDAANTWWSDRVVKFSYASQLDLLARFGVKTPDAGYLGWAFAAALVLWLLATGLAALVPRRRGDELGRAYRRLCARLARIAPARAAHQGPLDYCETVLAVRPDLRASLGALIAHYAQLRYGPGAAAPEAVARFARAVRRLRLAPAR